LEQDPVVGRFEREQGVIVPGRGRAIDRDTHVANPGGQPLASRYLDVELASLLQSARMLSTTDDPKPQPDNPPEPYELPEPDPSPHIPDIHDPGEPFNPPGQPRPDGPLNPAT
jgi:hypothetical protein